MLEHRDLTERIIGLAVEAHRRTGWTAGIGLRRLSELELEWAGIPLLRQVGVPVCSAKAHRYRYDFI
jgi:hypothetical protein